MASAAVSSPQRPPRTQLHGSTAINHSEGQDDKREYEGVNSHTMQDDGGFNGGNVY